MKNKLRRGGGGRPTGGVPDHPPPPSYRAHRTLGVPQHPLSGRRPDPPPSWGLQRCLGGGVEETKEKGVEVHEQGRGRVPQRADRPVPCAPPRTYRTFAAQETAEEMTTTGVRGRSSPSAHRRTAGGGGRVLVRTPPDPVDSIRSSDPETPGRTADLRFSWNTEAPKQRCGRVFKTHTSLLVGISSSSPLSSA